MKRQYRSGFCFDAASIPRFFWRVEQPINGKTLEAYCTHDWNYSTGCIPRKEADELLYKMLREAGMSWLKARCIYRAVRLFGGHHYNESNDAG